MHTREVPGDPLLPLLGKPFIEAVRVPRAYSPVMYCFPFWGSPSLRPRRLPHHHFPLSDDCFPFWGSPSLRRVYQVAGERHLDLLLPLLGKPFIEAV